MRRFLQRFPSLLARNFLHSPTNFRHSIPNYRVVPFLDRNISRFAFFSSESNPARGPISNEVVSKEELKNRIQRFLDDGDEDALPFMFEALMNRKLSGNHDESDDEVMEEVRQYPINDAHNVDVSDSDVESDGLSGGDSSDSDIESDDGLRDADSSDSDIESDDGLSGGDSSDSDFESDDGLRDGDSSESDSESD